LAEKASTDLDNLIAEMVKNDNVKNQDIMFLIGRARQLDLLKKIENQIAEIELSIDPNMLSKEDVIVRLPVKWFFEDLKVSLSYGDKSYEPVEIEASESEKAVYTRLRAGSLPQYEADYPGKDTVVSGGYGS